MFIKTHLKKKEKTKLSKKYQSVNNVYYYKILLLVQTRQCFYRKHALRQRIGALF